MEECSQTKSENCSSHFNCVEDNHSQEIEDTRSVKEEWEPKRGMIFDSFDNLVQYYRNYGNKMGFEAIIRSSRKGDDGEVKNVTLACSCTGKPRSNSRNAFKRRPVTKTNCKARIGVSICSDGKWQICSTVFDHNHELYDPTKARYFKKYKKRKHEVNDRAGVRPNQKFNSLLVETGVVENFQLLRKDCRNYIETVRRLRLSAGDASAIQKYFLKMQIENSDFFYLMDLDEEGRLKNVLWVDARSRAAFKEFGDVVTFDTTYLTNKYDMPFVAFVGVNHHGHLMLLGCGLISNKDTKTFVWLFQSWLTCMSNPPKAIITNQDEAMQNAIGIVFPDTRHRWCLWHIMKKLFEKLKGYCEYEYIKFSLQNVVYDSLTQEEFEERWNRFIDKHNLHNDAWLLGLYNERRRWVPTFVKDTFWAGMSVTQRSESIHAFFDGYINAKTTLKQFVEQYENVLHDKVEKEREADFKSFKSWIPCISTYAIEKQFQDAYTTTKFKEFQQELAAKLYCEVSSFKEIDSFMEFIVEEDVMVGESHRRVPFVVFFDETTRDVRCNCRLFEFRGILCRHAIVVLIRKQIFHVPEKYILRRWRKNINRCYTKVKISYDSWSTNLEGQRFDQLSSLFNTVADLASNNEDDCNMVIEMINDMKNKLMSNEIVGKIYKKLNMSANSRTNCEGVDGTLKKVKGELVI
ncbi:protein FAR-RED IMPAIRED RESPONSE 1-like isoform X2 [Mangifera indica]|nr:protein FAR-RED IMPAIRED RESPONSE 1-like isoform X2 [Mangifera indica]XP_044505677.1 protein FAR-RED IMPAIRED RESPONSE 1-like isoform X2 [Mangifera indica]XP_044505678.1 protein FAR-RED IMPAIRED RESPONSE 1-like isoform X2 [Mangifera indica]XP_044505680.1 protein FAR-RED IMPAIRED RESPONSE 1-like isoform X2 [Mangifera indica]XP_044505681.1 protein FAR-RED IMPAIRED RESPONSE 1-like isoform X2 [Mangifera indica]XP_044505682.1 protein FAR-RED IMPAIRED RESPONSE 1-like isoform X2 [Mangifera indica]